MRISDWSSDVYSSDLHGQERFQHDVSTARLPACCVAATQRQFASHSVNGKCNAAGTCRTLRQRATGGSWGLDITRTDEACRWRCNAELPLKPTGHGLIYNECMYSREWRDVVG